MSQSRKSSAEKTQIKVLQGVMVAYNIPFFIFLFFYDIVDSLGAWLKTYTIYIKNHFGLFMIIELLIVAILVADVILSFDKREKAWKRWTIAIAFLSVVLFSTKIVAKMFDMLYTKVDF